MRALLLVFISLTFLPMQSWSRPCPLITKGAKYQQTKDGWHLAGVKNYKKNLSAQNTDQTVNVVVEIPAGCDDKWEVDEKGTLIWDKKNGKFRRVPFLAYPANYGMIPGTLSGDGDPLDIVVIGPMLPRGEVIRARIVGILRAIDSGESDDKLIGIWADNENESPLRNAKDVEDLPKNLPFALKTWFEGYKPGGEMKVKAIQGRKDAMMVLSAAIKKNKSK